MTDSACGEIKATTQAKILIVEDENIVALDLERGLKRLGYAVVGAVNNGPDAIQKTDETRPDLILMDIQLKGSMDGIKAAQEIREWFGVPVVFLTSYADESTLDRAKISEPYGYLLKPFEETELRTTIEVVLHKHTTTMAHLTESNQALQRSEESFKLFVESVTDYGIFLVDPRGKVLSWNLGAERITGYRADEIIGENISIFYPKNDAAKEKSEQNLKVAAQEDHHEEIAWRRHKDGAEFWAIEAITALRDEDGKLRGYGIVKRDLTERKKAHDALKAANESLERRVQERTADLREALQTRDEFLSIAAHELKNPLTSLFLQLQMLSRSASQQGGFNFEKQKQKIEADPKNNSILSSEKQLKMIKSCEKSGKKLNQLLDELFDLTRIRIGKFALHKENMDLSALVREVIERKRDEIAQTGIPVLVKTDSPVIGNWDSIRVEQIVGNLLSNAIKYGENKSIEVSVEINPKTGCAKLSVLDHGQGISPEMREKIFKRFERAGAEKTKILGLGLGLYIVQQIVKAHGGSINVTSEVGRGSNFIVELPLSVFDVADSKTNLKEKIVQEGKNPVVLVAKPTSTHLMADPH